MVFRGKELANHSQWLPRKSVFIDRDFQFRYGVFFVGSILLSSFAVLLPAIFLVNSNYKIFIDMAYKVVPGIVDSLEKERFGLILGTTSLSIATCIFLSYLGFKQSLKMIGPIYALKRHLMNACRGVWSQPPVKVRANDEFMSLIDTYNYFYKTFRTNLKKELSSLETIDTHQLSKNDAWTIQNLINEKKLQLNLPSESSDHASSASAGPDSRHAS